MQPAAVLFPESLEFGFDNVRPYPAGSSKLSHFLKFSGFFFWFLDNSMRATFLAHLILFNLMTLVILLKSTNYEVSHYVFFTVFLLLRVC
jgi:hypothetical protein